MSSLIRACAICGESYWSMSEHDGEEGECPICAQLSADPLESLPAEPVPGRIKPVTCPQPGGRTRGTGLYAKGDDDKPDAGEMPEWTRSLPILPRPGAFPEVMQPAPQQQMGFNCPSCFTVLFIKDPSSYDGRAAPCPYCQVAIQAPRVAPPSPFQLINPPPADKAVDLPALLDAPSPRTSRWKPFKQNDFVPSRPRPTASVR